MNEEESHLRTWIDPDLGASIIALVLGEASDFEAEKLERLIEDRPELARYRKRMERMHTLLTEVVAGKNSAAGKAGFTQWWRLPEDRRKAVLAVLTGRDSEAVADPDEPVETSSIDAMTAVPESAAISHHHRRIRWRQWAKAAAGLALLGLIASIALPSYRSLRMAGAPQVAAAAAAEQSKEPRRASIRLLADGVDRLPAATPVRGNAEVEKSPAAVFSSGYYAFDSDAEIHSATREVPDSNSKAATSLSELGRTVTAFPVTPTTETESRSGPAAAGPRGSSSADRAALFFPEVETEAGGSGTENREWAWSDAGNGGAARDDYETANVTLGDLTVNGGNGSRENRAERGKTSPPQPDAAEPKIDSLVVTRSLQAGTSVETMRRRRDTENESVASEDRPSSPVSEKEPATGDLPMVGRLFKRKAEEEDEHENAGSPHSPANGTDRLGAVALGAMPGFQFSAGDSAPEHGASGRGIEGMDVELEDGESPTRSQSVDGRSTRRFFGGANGTKDFDFREIGEAKSRADAGTPPVAPPAEPAQPALARGFGGETERGLLEPTATKELKRLPDLEKAKAEISEDNTELLAQLDQVTDETKSDELEARVREYEMAYRMPTPALKPTPPPAPAAKPEGRSSPVDVGESFRTKTESYTNARPGEAGETHKGHGMVTPIRIDNSGSTQAAGEGQTDRGKVLLGPIGGRIANTGTITANRPNGAGGEILIDADGDGDADEAAYRQSFGKIKDALEPNGSSAGQNGDAVIETARSNSPADSRHGTTGTERQQKLADESIKLNPNIESAGTAWATPMAGGDADRDFGRFQSAQHEWQRYPGHPATAATPPIRSESLTSPEREGKETTPDDLAIQWDSFYASNGSFPSGVVDAESRIRTQGGGDINTMAGWTGTEADLDGFAEPTSRADINVAVTGGILLQSGGRMQEYAPIGHGGGASGWADERSAVKSRPPVVRRWREGFGGTGDSIDGSITESAPAGVIGQDQAGYHYRHSGDQTRAEFLKRIAEGWELPIPAANRNGQDPATAITREFLYPTEYDPPEIPNEINLESRFGDTIVNGTGGFPITPSPITGDYRHLGFRDQGKTFALRVAPPAGLEEKNAADEAFSTFSLHVSDVSFKLALAALAKGEWPEAGKIRIEEFINALDYGDPNPSQEDKVACRVEQAIHPFLQQRNLMRVSMRTAAAGRAGDTPLRLTFLLDNSGSMERADREETVRRAFALLADQLQPIDQVTLISFARQPRLLADKVGGDRSGELVEVVSNLPSEGGTNLEAALRLAFEKAQEQKADQAQNRIVLLTDGAANLGNAKPESLAAMIESMREAGIAFDAAGIGAEGLNDEILEALTRKGDGRYYLLDRPEDADAGFARQIAGALRPAAKNVKVQVEFNPDRVGAYKLLGFEKHRLKKEDFRDDSVDAAEMAAEEAGVAVYQFEARPEGEGEVGFVSVRFRDMSSGQMVERRWPIPYEPSAPRPDQAAPSMRVATAAALLAAKLNGEALGESVEWEELARLVSSLPEPMASKERVKELGQMIEQARQLAATAPK